MSTLTTFPDLVQRSDEWYEVRRGIITASVIGRFITPTLKVAANDQSRAIVAQLVAERITGWIEPTFQSAAMFRGQMDEPLARDLYSRTYAPVTEMGFMVRDWGHFRIGYSPDGLVGNDGLIEVKSREPKEHLRTILADEVPAGNMAQIQAGLLVSDRSWCDYLSYCGGMPMWRKRVTRDVEWSNAIIAAAEGFEATAQQMVDDYNAAVKGLPATERINYDEMVI